MLTGTMKYKIIVYFEFGTYIDGYFSFGFDMKMLVHNVERVVRAYAEAAVFSKSLNIQRSLSYI